MVIKRSKRLEQVTREFYGYNDRHSYYRLDRNEDPVGWDEVMFEKLLKNLSTYDFAAYSDSNELLDKISRWTEFSQESIYITAGADGAIKNIFEVYLDPEDIVLMQDPCWPMYWVYSNVYQAKIIKQPYIGNFEFDIEYFLHTIKNNKPKIVILANPNMPTGTMICFEDIEKIAQTCLENESLLIIDEAYHLFSSFSSSVLAKKFNTFIVE